MRKLSLTLSVVALLIITGCSFSSKIEAPLDDTIKLGMDKAYQQSVLMAKAIETKDSVLPRSFTKFHADKTMAEYYRPDFSSYHVVSNDTGTFIPEKRQTHQDAANGSAWTRGQLWGLDDYVMKFCETQELRYLNFATKIADSLIGHPNMPADGIPYWNYYAPSISNEPHDASTAAIMALALLELSQNTISVLGKKYCDFAVRQIRTLTSPEYLAEARTNGNFILMPSTGHKPGNSEVNVPLTYVDYFYVEALNWLKEISI